MDKEQNCRIDPAPHDQQASAACNQEQTLSAVPEEERVTLKLSSKGLATHGLTESTEQLYVISDMSSNSVHREIPQSPERNSIESENEIQLTDLNETDQILIETANSFYNFTVTEPKLLAGKLIGGVLGNRLMNAALIPAGFASCSSNYAPESFKVGSRLMFLVECGDNLRQLTTSVITRLLHRKTQNDCTPVNQPEHWDFHETLITRQMNNIKR